MSGSTMRLAVCLALLTWGSAAGAAEPSSSHPCAAMVQPHERLACYDRAFPPASDARTLEEQAARDFGLSAQEVLARSPAFARAKLPQTITARVVAVRESRGTRAFTLDNGQVWQQTDSNVLGRVEAGDSVEIRNAAFSSFLLITPGRVALRVRRVK